MDSLSCHRGQFLRRAIGWTTSAITLLVGAVEFDCSRALANGSLHHTLLDHVVEPGQTLSNVFAISRSISASGYDENVSRNGGSADYRVITSTGAETALGTEYRYDGTPQGAGVTVIRDGGATTCWNGKCGPTTDASGPLYNPLLWGVPPARLAMGVVWRVTISQPWEMGGAGAETVTVLGLDRAAGTITLMREGVSNGAALGSNGKVALTSKGKRVDFDVVPGPTHWHGKTTFRHGVVESDELVAEGTDSLRSASGETVSAKRRSIMLLNAAPPAKPD